MYKFVDIPNIQYIRDVIKSNMLQNKSIDKISELKTSHT